MVNVSRKRKKNNRGFSVMEVLVAIAIFGTVTLLIASIVTQGSRFFSKETTNINLQNDLQECSNKVADVLMQANSIEWTRYTDRWEVSVTSDKLTPNTKVIVWTFPRTGEETGSLYIFDNAAVSNPDDNPDESEGFCLSHAVKRFDLDVDPSCHPTTVQEDGTVVTDNVHVTQPVILNYSITVSDKKDTKHDSKTITLRNKLTSITKDGVEALLP